MCKAIGLHHQPGLAWTPSAFRQCSYSADGTFSECLFIHLSISLSFHPIPVWFWGFWSRGSCEANGQITT